MRLKKGMSQRELAKLAKVNRTTLRKIEDGTCPIPFDIAIRLAYALGYECVIHRRESSLKELRRQAATETDPDRRSKIAAEILLRLGVE